MAPAQVLAVFRVNAPALVKVPARFMRACRVKAPALVIVPESEA